MAGMLQLTRVLQADPAQVILPQCLSGGVIITLLLAVMHQVFQLRPILQVQLQLA